MVYVKRAKDLEALVLYYWTLVVTKFKDWYERCHRTLYPPEEYGTPNGTANTLGCSLPVCNILPSPATTPTLSVITYETLISPSLQVPSAETHLLALAFLSLVFLLGLAVGLACGLTRKVPKSSRKERARPYDHDHDNDLFPIVTAIVNTRWEELANLSRENNTAIEKGENENEDLLR